MTTFSVSAAGAAGVLATTITTPVKTSPESNSVSGESARVSVDVGQSIIRPAVRTLGRRANRTGEAKSGRQRIRRILSSWAKKP